MRISSFPLAHFQRRMSRHKRAGWLSEPKTNAPPHRKNPFPLILNTTLTPKMNRSYDPKPRFPLGLFHIMEEIWNKSWINHLAWRFKQEGSILVCLFFLRMVNVSLASSGYHEAARHDRSTTSLRKIDGDLLGFTRKIFLCPENTRRIYWGIAHLVGGCC